MASRVIEDSDDDELSTLSPVKPRRPPQEAEQSDPPVSVGGTDQHDDPRDSLRQPAALPSLDNRAKSPTTVNDEADVVPLPVGAKRKATTMEELESRKRAKTYAGGTAVNNRSQSLGESEEIVAEGLGKSAHVQDTNASLSFVEGYEEEIQTGFTEFRTVGSCSGVDGAAKGISRFQLGIETGVEDVSTAHPAPDQSAPGITRLDDAAHMDEEPALPSGEPVDLEPSRQKQKPVAFSSDGDASLPPAETYKPRPSRFRAAGTADELFESIDFSKRPEKAFKTGKNGKDSKRKKRRDSPQVDADGESQITNDGASVGMAAEPSIEEARAENGALPSEEPVEGQGDEQPSNHDRPFQNDKVQKRSRGRPKKKDSAPADAPAEPKKRGRKRRSSIVRSEPVAADRESPRAKAASEAQEAASSKTQRHRRAVLDSDESGDEDAHATKASADSQPGEVPLSPSKRTNGQPPRERTSISGALASSRTNENSDPKSMTLEDPPSDKAAAPPETPRKEHSALVVTPKNKEPSTGQKGPDKHSPINGSRAKYRVGLSKRARIAPLLQSVKK